MICCKTCRATLRGTRLAFPLPPAGWDSITELEPRTSPATGDALCAGCYCWRLSEAQYLTSPGVGERTGEQRWLSGLLNDVVTLATREDPATRNLWIKVREVRELFIKEHGEEEYLTYAHTADTLGLPGSRKAAPVVAEAPLKDARVKLQCDSCRVHMVKGQRVYDLPQGEWDRESVIPYDHIGGEFVSAEGHVLCASCYYKLRADKIYGAYRVDGQVQRGARWRLNTLLLDVCALYPDRDAALDTLWEDTRELRRQYIDTYGEEAHLTYAHAVDSFKLPGARTEIPETTKAPTVLTETTRAQPTPRKREKMEEKKTNATTRMLKDAVVRGTKTAAADEAATLLIEGVRTVLSEDLPEKLSEKHEMLLKVVSAAVVHALAMNTQLIPHSASVAVACQLVTEAQTRDFLQPKMHLLQPMLSKLAEVGKSVIDVEQKQEASA